jgi:hypothetical protein
MQTDYQVILWVLQLDVSLHRKALGFVHAETGTLRPLPCCFVADYAFRLRSASDGGKVGSILRAMRWSECCMGLHPLKRATFAWPTPEADI